MSSVWAQLGLWLLRAMAPLFLHALLGWLARRFPALAGWLHAAKPAIPPLPFQPGRASGAPAAPASGEAGPLHHLKLWLWLAKNWRQVL